MPSSGTSTRVSVTCADRAGRWVRLWATAVGRLACVRTLGDRCSDGRSCWHAGCPTPPYPGGHLANKLMRHLRSSRERPLEAMERCDSIIMETRLGIEAEEEW